MNNALGYVFLAGIGFVAGVYISSYVLGVDQADIYSGIKGIIVDGPKPAPAVQPAE